MDKHDKRFRDPNAIKPDTRTCSGCDTEKPFDTIHFPIHKRCLFGLDPTCRICFNKRANKRNLEYLRRVRVDVLTAYGKDGKMACQCCGVTNYEFLTLDHIHGGGKQERELMNQQQIYIRLRRQGYPKGDFRTLCWNCNCSYGAYGYCPHNHVNTTHENTITD